MDSFKGEEQSSEDLQDETMGWGKLAEGGVELFTLPGNHYTLLKKPSAQFLAARLKEVLL